MPMKHIHSPRDGGLRYAGTKGRSKQKIDKIEFEELLEIIACCDSTFYDNTAYKMSEQAHTTTDNRAQGRGENAVRYLLKQPFKNLELNGNKKSYDLEIALKRYEIKDVLYVCKKTGRHIHCATRHNATAMKKWDACKTKILSLKGFDFKNLTEDQKKVFTSSEVSMKKIMLLPRYVQEIIFEDMRPSIGIECEFVLCAGLVCYIIVEQQEYDNAFYFAGLTQGAVKYRLRYAYILERALNCELTHGPQRPQYPKLPAADLFLTSAVLDKPIEWYQSDALVPMRNGQKMRVSDLLFEYYSNLSDIDCLERELREVDRERAGLESQRRQGFLPFSQT